MIHCRKVLKWIFLAVLSVNVTWPFYPKCELQIISPKIPCKCPHQTPRSDVHVLQYSALNQEGPVVRAVGLLETDRVEGWDKVGAVEFEKHFHVFFGHVA